MTYEYMHMMHYKRKHLQSKHVTPVSLPHILPTKARKHPLKCKEQDGRRFVIAGCSKYFWSSGQAAMDNGHSQNSSSK